ncbi:MAG TPA: hypothetical protein VKA40_06570 [Nitrososphaera sp.]|jgi:hypothetical protein|nr:hypothetical protein [Nitrososphaera sp.]
MADNENIKAEIRMEAQRNAVDVAIALSELEREGPRIIEKGGQQLLERLYQNSR